MTVLVQSLIDIQVSKLISSACGPALTDREAEVFDHCQTLGVVYSGFVDEEFVCCWGLIPPSFLANEAYLWMWAPKNLRHQFLFVRHSQVQVERMLERYDTIIGHCKVGSRSAQRWLRWLGARFEEPKGDAVPFVIRRKM